MTKPADLAHLLAVPIVSHFLPFPTSPICIPYSLYVVFPIFMGATCLEFWTHPLNPRERRIIHFLLSPLLPHSSDYHNFFFLYCLPFRTNRLKFLLSYITTTTPQIFCTAMPVPPASFPIKHIHSNLHPQLTLACLVQSYPHHCPFKGQ